MATNEKPVVLTHPTFDDVTETVAPADVDQWVASGWQVAKSD